MKTNPISKPLVTPTSPEEVDAEHLQTLPEEELLQVCITRLIESCEKQGTTFHEAHDALDRARLECTRREQPDLFDAAFRIAFHTH